VAEEEVVRARVALHLHGRNHEDHISIAYNSSVALYKAGLTLTKVSPAKIASRFFHPK
jgi:hypothetical protein